MTAFSWTTTGSGTWNVAGNWNPTTGAPPGSTTSATDSATIGAKTVSYAVTINAGNSFDIATLNMGGQSNTHNSTLQINGSLFTNSLSFTTNTGNGGDASIAVGSGGLFDIRTSLSAINAEAVTVAGTGTGGRLMFGSASNSGISIDNANVKFSFSNNVSGLNKGVMEFAGPNFTVGTTTSQTIGNAAFGDAFVFDGANFTGDTATYSGTTLTVKSGAATVLTMNNLSLATGSSGFTFSGNTIQVMCYVCGTSIATPAGPRAIETLQPGDQVITLAAEGQRVRAVKWIGRRRIDLTAHPRPEVVAPIRIVRDAFADGIPSRDLFVSPDHGIYAEGRLICARQLVNDTTIRRERGWAVVEYFHIEVDGHAILLAEALPSESYLDTGNRGFFANGTGPHVLHPDLTAVADYPAREEASCVPFVWQEDDVRPVWERLSARATTLGCPVPVPETTIEPDLAVFVNGRALRPLCVINGHYQFMLPIGTAAVRLVSRAAQPNDAMPWVEDHRRLGVYVERLWLRSQDDVQDIPLDHPGLSQGWWDVERSGRAMRRWTNGEAILDLAPAEAPAVLEITATNSALTYLLEPAPKLAAA